MQGTSMAAPMVTGAVAMMLQKNAELTPDEVKLLLKKYSVQDDMTGILDENGSNIWGYGKLTVYDIMSSQEINVIPQIANLKISYNPVTKEVILQTKEEYNQDTSNELAISRVLFFDIAGRKLIELKDVKNKVINVAQLKTGVVIIKVFADDGGYAKAKMVIY
jgi:hypothetical protein